MLTGIFWIDTRRGRHLRESIARAAAHFRRRFGRDPNICLVPQGSDPVGDGHIRALRIRPCAALPPHHLWIGIEDLAARHILPERRGRRLS